MFRRFEELHTLTLAQRLAREVQRLARQLRPRHRQGRVHRARRLAGRPRGDGRRQPAAREPRAASDAAAGHRAARPGPPAGARRPRASTTWPAVTRCWRARRFAPKTPDPAAAAARRRATAAVATRVQWRPSRSLLRTPLATTPSSMARGRGTFANVRARTGCDRDPTAHREQTQTPHRHRAGRPGGHRARAGGPPAGRPRDHRSRPTFCCWPMTAELRARHGSGGPTHRGAARGEPRRRRLLAHAREHAAAGGLSRRHARRVPARREHAPQAAATASTRWRSA